MAYIAFDSSYAPCAFLIVPAGEHHYSDRAILIQTDWDWPGVASRLGWQPCDCGGTDGTVDCKACDRATGKMIAEAYDWIAERDGEDFDTLNDYFEER